jgi:hypothetical protein
MPRPRQLVILLDRFLAEPQHLRDLGERADSGGEVWRRQINLFAVGTDRDRLLAHRYQMHPLQPRQQPVAIEVADLLTGVAQVGVVFLDQLPIGIDAGAKRGVGQLRGDEIVRRLPIPERPTGMAASGGDRPSCRERVGQALVRFLRGRGLSPRHGVDPIHR